MVHECRDIEWLVNWALEKQGLGWIGGDSGALSSRGHSMAALGVRVDVSYAGGGLPPPGPGRLDDDDAMRIRKAIEQLPAEAAALVIRYGRIGARPEFGEDGYGVPEQMVKAGKPQWLWRDPAKRRGKIGPKLDWAEYETRVERVDYERAEWTAWREALVVLAEHLGGKLNTYDVTGPKVAAEPWASLPDAGPVDIPYRGSLRERRTAAQSTENARPMTFGPITRKPEQKKPRLKRAKSGADMAT